ncbi:MAG TPA: GDSL-type esterase/lipase family protein [Vicinamibacterales bacterium]|nr:GDSL-type esterase/lipase family protein [Vicinamibacterales bacterium]
MHKLAGPVGVLVCLLAAGACDDKTPTSPTSPGPGPGPGPSPTATLTATRFLAFGDSLTEGEITSPAPNSIQLAPMVVVPNASYPARLQERLRSRYRSQASELTVTNAGRSGELVANGEARLAQLLANSQTQALLLLHGYNDLLDYGAGGVSPASASINRLARDGRFRGARVFIGLMPPPIPGRQRSVPDDVVRAFNDELRAIAAGEGAVVVDVYSALSGNVSGYIGIDGHHPNEAGYQRIAEEFLARIAAELEPR